eukprot:1200432-Pleurochrysis_carterae.AAC.1
MSGAWIACAFARCDEAGLSEAVHVLARVSARGNGHPASGECITAMLVSAGESGYDGSEDGKDCRRACTTTLRQQCNESYGDESMEPGNGYARVFCTNASRGKK